MNKNFQMWHAVILLVITIISAIGSTWVMTSRVVIDRTKRDASVDLTLSVHQERITKLETNADIDRRQSAERYDRILSGIYDLRVLLEKKQDRHD